MPAIRKAASDKAVARARSVSWRARFRGAFGTSAMGTGRACVVAPWCAENRFSLSRHTTLLSQDLRRGRSSIRMLRRVSQSASLNERDGPGHRTP